MSIDSRQNKQQKLDLHETDLIARVDEYKFEPIRGYPMLHWAGKRPFTSTQYYPAQHKETHGQEVSGWRNKLYWGDNLQVMGHLLKEYRGKIKLIYIDPPFDSKADYTRTISIRGKSVTSDTTAFEEKQYADIWTNDEYLQFIYERIILIKELLSNDGSLYVHCDPSRNSYLRLILDEVFGPTAFVNEIVWQRLSAHNDSKRYGIIHDTIYYYAKSEARTWNPQSLPLSERYIEQFFDTVEENTGRRYSRSDLTARGLRNGETGKSWRGVSPSEKGNHWKVTISQLDEWDQEGRIHWPKNGGMPRLKRYLDEVMATGASPQDIWYDVKPIHNQSQELSDYPTQKPEALLDRIIQTSSRPGDIVLDCFIGSGTTAVAATKHGRRFIGADINLGAIQLTTTRLMAVASELCAKPPTLGLNVDETPTYYTGFEVYNVNNYDIFRNPVQAKELLIQALEINPLQPGSLFDGERDGRMWKIMPVNRIATRQDLTEVIVGMDYKTFERRLAEHPNQSVEKITLVCMGHEPDLSAYFQQAVPFKLDVEVVDILRDKQDLQFKRDSEAYAVIRDGELVIEKFFPLNLLHKLSLQKEYVEDWRELVDAIMVDWNYDGAVLEPAVIDVPEHNELVKGRYRVPADAGTIRVKITDLLSESLEMELPNG